MWSGGPPSYHQVDEEAKKQSSPLSSAPPLPPTTVQRGPWQCVSTDRDITGTSPKQCPGSSKMSRLFEIIGVFPIQPGHYRDITGTLLEMSRWVKCLEALAFKGSTGTPGHFVDLYTKKRYPLNKKSTTYA